MGRSKGIIAVGLGVAILGYAACAAVAAPGTGTKPASASLAVRTDGPHRGGENYGGFGAGINNYNNGVAIGAAVGGLLGALAQPQPYPPAYPSPNPYPPPYIPQPYPNPYGYQPGGYSQYPAPAPRAAPPPPPPPPPGYPVSYYDATSIRLDRRNSYEGTIVVDSRAPVPENAMLPNPYVRYMEDPSRDTGGGN